MKLVFPNGEHGQVLLSAGVNRIGTTPTHAVVLTGSDIRPLHCEIHITDAGANLQVPQGGGAVSVNGRPVSDIMALRSGDQIDIGTVVATFTPLEPAHAVSPSDVVHDDDDLGATRVRMAVPRFVLRGVSGAVFGKVFPVAGPVVIGRAPECDITVNAEEISRRHALVKPVGDGLSVEDLESSNGTYINTRRVQHGFLAPGDELRLDAVRFLLIAPGMETSQQALRAAPAGAEPPIRAARRRWVPIVLTAAAVLLAAAFMLVPG
ncbi:FHA domain-containing protein [Luteimonas sp. WGS1318]|uniref:FHA domain-containing protein n=1 Tax=Luteimonas sp. WGS1318 TaxID=3366815 RepID=UPI00372CE954